MRISHITTKTSTFRDEELQEAFKALNTVGHPFTLWVDLLGSKYPIPFQHGTALFNKVEKCIQDLVRREFGDEVHFA